MDVRMLGTGRPFIIEFIDPHGEIELLSLVVITLVEGHIDNNQFESIQNSINESTKYRKRLCSFSTINLFSLISVRKLQAIPKSRCSEMKEGAEEKTKTFYFSYASPGLIHHRYRCVIWTSRKKNF